MALFDALTPAQQQEVIDAQTMELPAGGFSSAEVRDAFVELRGQVVLDREQLAVAEAETLAEGAVLELIFDTADDSLAVLEAVGADIPSRAVSALRGAVGADNGVGGTLTAAGIGVLLALGLVAAIVIFK